MSQITVEPASIKNSSASLSTLSTDLKKTAQAVQTIHHNLSIHGSSTSQITRSFVAIETSILKEATYMSNLSKALQYIASQYETSEKAVSGQMSGLQKVIHNFNNDFVDFLSKIGLDKYYYRHQYGYEGFQSERTQERLMDEYLQEKCAQLLSSEKYSEEAWNKASRAEREQMLRDFIKDVESYLDTGADTNVKFESLSGGTRGYYSSDTNSVTINSNYLDPVNAESYMIFRTMIHEMRHAYQYNATQDPEKYVVTETTLQQWERNFDPKNYISYDPKKNNYKEYVSQPIEWDAKNFAHQEGDLTQADPTYEGSWKKQ